MRLSEKEKAANRAAFRAMNLRDKAEYIFAYYKLPLVLALVAIVAFASVTRWLITHKEPLLYVAYVNVVPDERLDKTLTTDFVEAEGKSPRRCEVVCFREIYLSRDTDQQSHQYAYASKLKVMAAVDAEQLDVVLMNQEAYDLLSASGYLLDLEDAQAVAQSMTDEEEPLLVSNTVVLSDNSVEVELNEADEYEAETIEQVNALDVTALPLFADYPEDESFYLGIIANTPRLDESLAYLQYVVETD
jgi:hypothetical protein